MINQSHAPRFEVTLVYDNASCVRGPPLTPVDAVASESNVPRLS